MPMGAEMSEDIRVLVVDESPGLAQGLILALPRRGPVHVLGPVPDAPEALAALEEGLADLVLVDLDREDGRGAEVVWRDPGRLGADPRPGGQHPGRTRDGSHGAGGRSCGVLPTVRDRSLIDVFRRAVAGELVLPDSDLPRLVDRLMGNRDHADGWTSLTGRERQILRALADGRSTPEIARELGISPLTVQSHVKNILAKLGVHSKVEAVRLAWRNGLGSATRTA